MKAPWLHIWRPVAKVPSRCQFRNRVAEIVPVQMAAAADPARLPSRCVAQPLLLGGQRFQPAGGHMIWLGLVAVVVVGFGWAKMRRQRKTVEASIGS
jgi:hypothetical protein